MIITLIGYRGSGKTTVAKPLAERLGWNWVDADAALEAAAGCTIREIFEQEGEPGFRRRERETISQLLRQDRLVLAAGGGAILNADTRHDIKAAGPVIWLRAPVDVLYSRIAGDSTTAQRRPALAGGGKQEIETLLAAREPLYRECATLTIDTSAAGTGEIVEQICREVQRPTP
jgi:shikimate kinase